MASDFDVTMQDNTIRAHAHGSIPDTITTLNQFINHCTDTF